VGLPIHARSVQDAALDVAPGPPHEVPLTPPAGTSAPDPAPETLIAEQIAFYRADASAYESWRVSVFERGGGGAFGEVCRRDRARALAALERAPLRGHVLELAAGTGAFTPALLARADRVTAVDASPESLRIARSSLAGFGDRVSFVEADVFSWRPPRRYDGVCFSYWLSHVPPSRFESFWRQVADALAPGGRVCFVDAARSSLSFSDRDEAGYGERDDLERQVSVRELAGRSYRVVKVVHEPAELEARLAQLGWQATVQRGEISLWGSAARARSGP
jgi:demethylmenaquinone methyltransferase/2-methoxy-6-polyprenyl-1,4-benzoquinol methylase